MIDTLILTICLVLTATAVGWLLIVLVLSRQRHQPGHRAVRELKAPQ